MRATGDWWIRFVDAVLILSDGPIEKVPKILTYFTNGKGIQLSP